MKRKPLIISENCISLAQNNAMEIQFLLIYRELQFTALVAGAVVVVEGVELDVKAVVHVVVGRLVRIQAEPNPATVCECH